MSGVKIGRRRDAAATRRKETFSATSKSSLPDTAPSILSGEITNSEAREERCFLCTQVLCWPLRPPVPSSSTSFLQHNNNLPICCNQTSPLLIHPRFLCPPPFVFPHPRSQPHHPCHLPHYLPPPLPRLARPAGRLLIGLIGGVRMQLHPSPALHSSAGPFDTV